MGLQVLCCHLGASEDSIDDPMFSQNELDRIKLPQHSIFDLLHSCIQFVDLSNFKTSNLC